MQPAKLSPAFFFLSFTIGDRSSGFPRAGGRTSPSMDRRRKKQSKNERDKARTFASKTWMLHTDIFSTRTVLIFSATIDRKSTRCHTLHVEHSGRCTSLLQRKMFEFLVIRVRVDDGRFQASKSVFFFSILPESKASRVDKLVNSIASVKVANLRNAEGIARKIPSFCIHRNEGN